jgi:thioesterase domain-containing protein
MMGPSILAGYSGGGVLAYEMAQQLRRQGRGVDLLVLIDTYHPAVRTRRKTWSERIRNLWEDPVGQQKNFWWGRVVFPLLIGSSLLRYVKLGRRVPLERRREILQYYFYKTKNEYRPQPYAGRVLLVRSLEVNPILDHVSPHLGWDGLISDLQITDVPGNHFQVVQEPVLPHLVATIETHVRLRNMQKLGSKTFSRENAS